jgi:hypothetical protein
MKYLIILSLIVASCTKQEKHNDTCDCYEYHEKYGPIVINNLSYMQWNFEYQTTPGPDLCEKDNGQWIQYGNANQYRYRTICN